MTAVALTARRRGRPSLDEAERFLLDALHRIGDAPGIARVRFPAPDAPLEALRAGLRKAVGASWRAPDGAAFAAHGATARLTLGGPARFEALEPRSEALFGAVRAVRHPELDERAPRLWGGWAFAPGSADAHPWDGFGDGAFVLPRWTYERGAAGPASLALAVDAATVSPAQLRAELRTVWQALGREPAAPAPVEVVRTAHLGRDAWRAQVDAITGAIAEGRFEKVVAARRATVFGHRDFDAAIAARALRERYPDTWCFAMRLGAGTFVGATPERLFAKRGRTIETDALAGSIAVGDEGAEAALRASLKDRREHRPVVEHLLERLAPLCESLREPSEPRVRRLPNVLHLHTAVRGTLAPGVHAARLAAALHPTPAVGGVPSAAATAWIEANEAHPRGWYSGPVGWIDAEGDAELTVALRCGLIRGNTAWVWAGGGIVEGSEPEAEWRESSWKLQPLLAALGAA